MIIYWDSEQPKLEFIDQMKDTKIIKKTIGSYHLREYYTETIFNHSSLLYTNFQSTFELVKGLTAYHEGIHFLQDIGTGFGCFNSELIRLRNESIIEKLREWDKNEDMKIPFNESKNITSISMNEKIKKDCIYNYNQFNFLAENLFDMESFNFLFKGEFGNQNVFPKTEDLIKEVSKIEFHELFEGVTSLFSHCFCIYFGKKFPRLDAEIFGEDYKDFFKCRTTTHLPEVYKRTIRYLSKTLFPYYEKVPIEQKLNLLFLLSDFSLHIPTTDLFVSTYNNSQFKNKFPSKDFFQFMPSIRFFYSINAIIDLDLEFPDSSKQGYTDFVNKICNHPELKWYTMEATTDMWIKFLENQSKEACADTSLKWKLDLMNQRKKIPHLFSSFWDIHKTMLERKGKIPFINKTETNNFVCGMSKSRDSDPFEDVHDAIKINFIKKFQNSIIEQIIEGGIITCFLPNWIIDCNRGRRDCWMGIDNKDTYYSKKCIYSNWFEEFFQLPFDILRPVQHIKKDSNEVEYERSMEEIIKDLINTVIVCDFERMQNEIKELKNNRLYNYLRPTSLCNDELFPSFEPKYLKFGIPIGLKHLVIDSRWDRAWELYEKGLSSIDQNDTANAIKYFKEMTESYANFWQSWYNLGVEFSKMNMHLEAFKKYGEALKWNPIDYRIWNNLGFSLARIKRWREAVIFLEEALELRPNDYLAFNNLMMGYIYLYNTFKIARKEKEATEIYAKIEKVCFQNEVTANEWMNHYGNIVI